MQWSTWKCECLRRRRSIAGCHILWFMSLYFENNCFWLVLPLGYLFQSNECELVCCTVLNNNAYCTAIYEKNCSINEILASTVQIFFFLLLLSALEHRGPVVDSGIDLNEKRWSLSFSPDTTHTAFSFFCRKHPPLSPPHIPPFFSFSLCLETLYFWTELRKL